MVHDSVREELALKISPIVKTAKPPVVEEKIVVPKTAAPKLEEKPAIMPPPIPIPPMNPVIPKSPPTSEIMSKATSPTLIGFQNKNATVPDWRLQLQNSVRKRLDGQRSSEDVESFVQTSPRRVNLVTSGANALQTETVEEINPPVPANSKVKNALKRIEESRRRYLTDDGAAPSAVEPAFIKTTIEQTTVKAFPRTLSAKSPDFLPKQNETTNETSFAKPNIVQFTGETKVEKFDTNKLPPLPLPAKISSSFEKRPVEPKKIHLDFDDDDLLEIHQTNGAEVAAYGEAELLEIDEVDGHESADEVEDYAPLPLRFNAALFDLLICSFLSLVLLSPFMLLNGRFFSLEGFFAFLATVSIVMFIYLTTTIGFLGRTFGMRIFSLEIVDVEENDYPTLHQAAVSSSVYLISLALGGIGFLTMLLNSEKRAAHDLLSGTIIVKEY
jgi:uncharacterized RDD family membrane protein YckC